MPSTILSDNGASSGTSGIKTTGSNDGQLALQTTTAGGATATGLTINNTQQVAFTAGSAASPAITPTGDDNTGIFFPAADTIAFAEGGVESMRITSDGRLGIGTTSPSQALTVGNGGKIALVRASPATNTGFVYTDGNGTTLESDTTNSDPVVITSPGTGGTIRMSTAGSERMRITSSGNVGIGTSSPTFVTGGGLQISNSTQANLRLSDTTNSGYNFDLFMNETDAYVANRANGPLCFFTNNAERARISAAGGFSVGTTADPGAGAIYATGNITAYYSDSRLKDVKGNITGALDKVASLNGVYYTNNDVAAKHGYTAQDLQVGLLAQQVEAVLPEVVKAAPFDLDENGNSKSGENYKTVQYERIIPLLVEAIKELRAEVKALKGE